RHRSARIEAPHHRTILNSLSRSLQSRVASCRSAPTRRAASRRWPQLDAAVAAEVDHLAVEADVGAAAGAVEAELRRLGRPARRAREGTHEGNLGAGGGRGAR